MTFQNTQVAITEASANTNSLHNTTTTLRTRVDNFSGSVQTLTAKTLDSGIQKTKTNQSQRL
jgi:hypothetical protein